MLGLAKEGEATRASADTVRRRSCKAKERGDEAIVQEFLQGEASVGVAAFGRLTPAGYSRPRVLSCESPRKPDSTRKTRSAALTVGGRRREQGRRGGASERMQAEATGVAILVVRAGRLISAPRYATRGPREDDKAPQRFECPPLWRKCGATRKPPTAKVRCRAGQVR